MTLLVIDATRNWLSISNFLKKTLKWKEVSPYPKRLYGVGYFCYSEQFTLTRIFPRSRKVMPSRNFLLFCPFLLLCPWINHNESYYRHYLQLQFKNEVLPVTINYAKISHLIYYNFF